MKIANHYLAKIPKTKITTSILAAASIFAMTIISLHPIDVNAEYDQFQIPEISGTITVTELSDNHSDDALSVAMAV